MLDFLDRFNPIHPHCEIPLNITHQLYNIQIMKIILDLLGQHSQSETLDDTIHRFRDRRSSVMEGILVLTH